MVKQAELQSLVQTASLQPADVLQRAESLRQRSRQCTDLADTSVTADAKQVFSSLAQELESEADKLENAVEMIGQLYSSASANEGLHG